MRSLFDDVKDYEDWLGTQCQVVGKDLRTKHVGMASDPFVFLRATYFRWARTAPELCPQVLDAPSVACVGDVHVENYGTWRDADGREVWGLNDFDEAGVMPYTLDLLRLTCSACMVPAIELTAVEAATMVLEGYRAGLAKPGPVLASQGADWYRKVAAALVDASARFWQRYDAAEEVEPPPEVREALGKSMPPGTKLRKFTALSRGEGSLGRPRFQALGKWQGGKVIREAKAIVPSAWYWASGSPGRLEIRELAYGRYRSPDPSVEVRGRYLCRRVSPSERRLDLGDVGGPHVMRALLGDMGRELASIHRADPQGVRIADDIGGRKKKWLAVATEAMLEAVHADFASWASAWHAGDTAAAAHGAQRRQARGRKAAKR